MTAAIAAGLVFALGLGLLMAAVRRPQPKTEPRSDYAGSLTGALPLTGALRRVSDGEQQNLRLSGITPQAYAIQRLAGLIGGAAAGLILSVLLLRRGPVGTAVITLLAVAVGWFLPMLGARDTARRARAELDQIIRVWIMLVAQQVSAGVDPSAAMLATAQLGQRPNWRLLYRFLLRAQQERRPVWEGLVDLVERYGIHSLAPIVSALGLAAQRGTRLSEAVLAAAETLWEDSNSRQREAADRWAQIIVVPATGVAIALAGILVYPPFTNLTGGGIVGGS